MLNDDMRIIAIDKKQRCWLLDENNKLKFTNVTYSYYENVMLNHKEHLYEISKGNFVNKSITTKKISIKLLSNIFLVWDIDENDEYDNNVDLIYAYENSYLILYESHLIELELGLDFEFDHRDINFKLIDEL